MASMVHDMDCVDANTITSKLHKVRNTIGSDIKTSQSNDSSSRSDGREGTGSDDEIDETRKVIEDILELQKALVELTLKNQNIVEEKHEIEEEVQVLQKYIDNMMRNSYCIVAS